MAKNAKKAVTVKVKVRCVQCKATKEVGPGDVPEGEMPTCDQCHAPMVAVSATRRL